MVEVVAGQLKLGRDSQESFVHSCSQRIMHAVCSRPLSACNQAMFWPSETIVKDCPAFSPNTRLPLRPNAPVECAFNLSRVVSLVWGSN